MINDPRDLEGSRLREALSHLGRDPLARHSMIALLKTIEGQLDYAGSVRDDITGPVVDALHSESNQYEKVLADGTRFTYLYRTKIARDFLMADEEHPTHVWEPQTTKLLMELTRNLVGDVIVGGAYFGDQAILVARNLPPGGRVHCFEPNPDQAAMLVKNIEVNLLGNVVVNHNCLWSDSDLLLKLDGFDSFANTVSAASNERDSVNSVSIDDYCDRNGLKLGLIQLDIEGAEQKALLGARRALEGTNPHVIFEIHRHYVDWSHGLAQTEICRYLANFGYTMFAIRDFNSHYEMGKRPIELIPLDKVYLDGPPHGFNMLAIKDTGLISNPAFSIVENVSPKLLQHKDPALHHPVGGL